jgi:hypothetical protein
MADRGHYEEYASQCLRQARESHVPEQKALLLMMARAWTRMAEQTERLRILLSQTGGERAR